MNIIVFDTEATGITNPELIEFGCVFKTSDKDGEQSFNCKPEQKILPASTVIHGITQEKANTFPDPKDTADAIYNFLKSFNAPLLFVAHNISYDNQVIKSLFEKYLDCDFDPKTSIDTLKFAKHLIPSTEIGGYSLDAVFYYLFPERLEYLITKRASHGAVEDCRLTYEVLIELKKRLDEKNNKELCWDEVIEFVSQPFDLSDEVWGFGKHKGIKFRDTPRGYIRWCLSSDFATDPKNADIVYTLKKYA